MTTKQERVTNQELAYVISTLGEGLPSEETLSMAKELQQLRAVIPQAREALVANHKSNLYLRQYELLSDGSVIGVDIVMETTEKILKVLDEVTK